MIVPMQKITLLVSAEDRDEALNRLRQLGLVHIQAVRAPAAEEVHSLQSELAGVDRAMELTGVDPDIQPDPAAAVGADAVQSILALGQERDELRRELTELQANDAWFQRWGPVSLASVQTLREAGIVVRFYAADKKDLQKLPADAVTQVVAQTSNGVLLAYFTRDTGDRLELREETMPPVEVGPMRERMAEIRQRLEQIGTQLEQQAVQGPGLALHRLRLTARLELATVKHGMGVEGPIAYLQGFCPEEQVNRVKRAAAEHGWAYAIQDPDDPQQVPTLVRSPAWVRIIKPVFAFMGTVPGYHEYDISAWFLLFFGLFYAMLVGDGGYGLIFLGATVYARRKMRQAPPEPFRLMYVLSLATIGWGAISGTWFGMEGILDIPALSFLGLVVIEPISSMGGDQDFMMHLCFLIGAIQLSIAHALIGLRHIRSAQALAQLGWIGIIWSLFFIAGTLVLGREFPVFASTLLGGSVTLVLLFANYQPNVLKGVLITLGDLPLSIISSFSDVVSYLRLFAVGFATFIVANSFNQMAAEAGVGLLGSIAAAVILFLGHGINIILALMAVVVHGIRLNMLEFSGHLNMQWSGVPYRPFKATEAE